MLSECVCATLVFGSLGTKWICYLDLFAMIRGIDHFLMSPPCFLPRPGQWLRGWVIFCKDDIHFYARKSEMPPNCAGAIHFASYGTFVSNGLVQSCSILLRS